jgi:RNA recognition motif-containing protein
LELHTFPQGITEKNVELFFSQFGKVKEVSVVKNYSELLDQAKDIYEVSQRKK